MKHATPEALDQLEPLLAKLRTVPELREKKRGIFYRTSKAFLHFHEDPKGLFCDLRGDLDFDRYPVNTARQRDALLSRVRTRARS